MRAIQTVSLGKAVLVDLPDPEVKENTILVRPHCVGNNPCDYLVTDVEEVFSKGQIIGCDYSGVVEQIGPDVNTLLKPGDRVCGGVAGGVGCDVTKGAFADLILAEGDLCFPQPQTLSDAQAATLGVAVPTIAVSFYQNFGIPLPDDEPDFGKGKSFFIYGGSSTTGLLAIQFAKLSGFHIITTCSPQNFGLVKGRGADEAYDYHDYAKCVKDIKASVGEDLKYAYVCIGGEEPAKLCGEVLSSQGGKYVTIVGNYCPRQDVQSTMTFGQSVMADPYKEFAGVANRTAETKALGQRVWKLALRYFEEGKIQPPPLELRQGLEGALQGVNDLREGLVSGRKIVSQLV